MDVSRYGVFDPDTRWDAWDEMYESQVMSGLPAVETRRFVTYSEIENEIKARIEQVRTICQGDIPFTWQMEDYLHKKGKLPQGRLRPWKQVLEDCTAVASAGAVQKVSVKDVTIFQNEEQIYSPSPSWLYALSRNQVGHGRLGNRPGSTLPWIGEAINCFGLLFLELPGVPQYTKELSENWADNKWANPVNGKPPYLEFEKLAQGRHLTQVRCNTASQVVGTILAGGAVIIASDKGLEPFVDAEGYRRYRFDPNYPMHHMMYFSDYKGKTCKGPSVLRWQLWGTPQNLIGGFNEPSGCAWQSVELLAEELAGRYPEALGFLSVIGQPTEPDYNLVKNMVDAGLSIA